MLTDLLSPLQLHKNMELIKHIYVFLHASSLQLEHNSGFEWTLYAGEQSNSSPRISSRSPKRERDSLYWQENAQRLRTSQAGPSKSSDCVHHCHCGLLPFPPQQKSCLPAVPPPYPTTQHWETGARRSSTWSNHVFNTACFYDRWKLDNLWRYIYQCEDTYTQSPTPVSYTHLDVYKRQLL